MPDQNVPKFDDIPDQGPSQGQVPAFDDIPDQSVPKFDDLPDHSKPTTSALAAGIEGFGRGLAGPVVPYLEKRWGYATPEEQLKREQEHPVAAGVGQVAGLMAPWSAEGKAMTMAGEGAAKLLGIAKPATYAARVGSSIVKNAAEMTVMGMGDDTAKMVMNDPNTSTETALGHIGLNAAIGAGGGAFFTGAVSPIWKATVGNKVESGLKSLLDSVQSTSGRTSVQDLSKMADIPVSDVLTAKGNGVPLIGEKIDQMASASDSRAGKSAAKALQEDSERINNKIAEVTTGDPNYLENVPKEDNHTTGQNVVNSLQKDLGNEINATTSQMDQSAKALDHAPFSVQNQGQTADDIAQTIINNNWHKGQSDADLHLMEDVLHKLDRQETAGDLRTYINSLRNKDTESAQVLKKILNDAIDRSHEEFAQSAESKVSQDAFKQVSPKEFVAARSNSKRGSFLSPTPAEELKNHKLFVSADGRVGYALSPEGDLQGVFNNSARKGAGAEAVHHAIANGAKTLDAFDNFLPGYYKKFGFRETGRAKFADEFAPKDWNYKEHGRPDVVFMKHQNPAELAQEYKTSRASLEALNGKLDALNQHLHIGKFDNPQEFLTKMTEKYGSNPEAMLKNLSGKAKADTIQLLAQISPDTLEVIRQHHVNELMRDSMVNGRFSALKYTNKLNDLSPQIRGLVADPIKQQQLNALTQLAQHANVKASFADKQAESLLKKIKTPLALIAAINGHGLRAVMDILGIHVAKEGKEAVKLSLLKMLSSSQPANAEGFQSMANFISNVYKGQNTIAKGVANVLGTGGKVAITHYLPTQEDRDKLQKQIDKVTQDPNKSPQSSLGHYMDQHQAAMQAITNKQIQYLNGLKPKDAIISPLEPAVTASKAAMARYNRAMDIALNPMICLKKIKDGSLQATDCADLSNMYPSLRNSIANQFTAEMSKGFSKEEAPSYKARMGLSLFLGTPLDNTMTPQSIMAAQPKPQQGPQQPPAPKGKGKGSPSKMSNKSSNLAKTADQAAETDRSDRD